MLSDDLSGNLCCFDHFRIPALGAPNIRLVSETSFKMAMRAASDLGE
jgi:hypothetical protein